MNEHTRKQMSRFITILKNLGLTEEQTLGICSMMKTEDMVLEIVQTLEDKDFNLTPQEVMNIASSVIKRNL